MPQHWVVEDVVYTFDETHRRRRQNWLRPCFGTPSHQVHVGSRRFASGALLAAGLGVLASVPAGGATRAVSARLTARKFARTIAGRFVQLADHHPPASGTNLAGRPGMQGEDQIGFSVEEMATIGERMLRDIGLTSSFSRLVLFHGPRLLACLNNPHKSAYDCGEFPCSGSLPGGPNARALAAILNDLPRAAEILADRGLPIP